MCRPAIDPTKTPAYCPVCSNPVHTEHDLSVFADTEAIMFADSLACNPRPFLRALYLTGGRNGGPIQNQEDMRSDRIKRILYNLIRMAYGELSTVSLWDEYDRLEKTVPAEKAGTAPREADDVSLLADPPSAHFPEAPRAALVAEEN